MSTVVFSGILKFAVTLRKILLVELAKPASRQRGTPLAACFVMPSAHGPPMLVVNYSWRTVQFHGSNMGHYSTLQNVISSSAFL